AGSSTSAATRPSGTWRGCSTPSSRAGSTTTGGSTSPPCTHPSGRSTSTSLVGPSGSTSGSGGTRDGHGGSSPALRCASRTSSPIGDSGCDLTAGQREPDEPRGSRPVLREPGGETPPGYSPRRGLRAT